MLVRAFSASTFGLRSGIPMEAAQTNVYRARARMRIACRHYAIDSNTFGPFTQQEARGADAPFKGVRVHSAHKGDETGDKPVSRQGTTPLSVRAPYPRPSICAHRETTGTGLVVAIGIRPIVFFGLLLSIAYR